jgi:membrane dipeptidase
MADSLVVVDAHLDVPGRLLESREDIAGPTRGGFDYPKAREGGLDVPFFAIYTPAEQEGTGRARAYADSLIGVVERVVARSPQRFRLVRTPSEARGLSGSGLIAVALGMENGTPLEGDTANIRHFAERGIAYITLTHSRNNHIADASFDRSRQWNGLSPFGVTVIRTMNRLGVMIDVSHVSDSAFWQILRLSSAPVIATHSSCRHFTPGWERNMSDEMIRALAGQGGVICINFGNGFLRDDIRRSMDVAWPELYQYMRERGLSFADPEFVRYQREYRRLHNIPYASVADVADHIDWVVKIAGVDHVGLGSDFDGLGDDLPDGLRDVSGYPNMIAELLRRGYTVPEIRNICGENVLRVWALAQRRGVQP